MNTRQRQTGMSIPGMLVIAIMVGFFVMCIIRMTPPYFEYLSVKDIIQQVVMEHEPETQSIGQIRRRIDNLFNTNQIYELQAKDVEVYRKDGKTFIDASYEVRIPVMGRIDAVLKFDDLKYVAGNPTPLTGLAEKSKK
jgi:hypothetical protein